jgi:ADP-ribose pyrophosphatase YjhB (NUDIX family)
VTGPNLREAARAVVLDEDDRILMVKYIFPSGEERWGTPGGGLDAGESYHAGIRREVREELGLVDVEIGPHVWNRVYLFPMLTGHDGQRERFFLVRVRHFSPEPEIGWERMNAEFVHDIRWWTLDEIDASTERFIPPGLTGHVRTLLVHGAPADPIDVST